MTSKRDLSRFDQLQRIGCIACRMEGFHTAADVHHILSGGRRTGHQGTIPLCPWHHRGFGGDSTPAVLKAMGPSLAHGSKAFHAHFGTQVELLAKVNSLIEGRKS